MAELYKSVTELMKTARGNKALQDNLGDITDFQQIIDDTPTADVVEVKHGEWIPCGDGEHTPLMCSSCLNTWGFYKQRGSVYCPNCGAKMYGERKDT